MNEKKILLAVYDEKGTLLGYKSDSLWNLDTRGYTKRHTPLSIPQCMENLVAFLDHGIGLPFPSDIAAIIGATRKSLTKEPLLRVVVEDVIAGKIQEEYILQKSDRGYVYKKRAIA